MAKLLLFRWTWWGRRQSLDVIGNLYVVDADIKLRTTKLERSRESRGQVARSMAVELARSSVEGCWFELAS